MIIFHLAILRAFFFLIKMNHDNRREKKWETQRFRYAAISEPTDTRPGSASTCYAFFLSHVGEGNPRFLLDSTGSIYDTVWCSRSPLLPQFYGSRLAGNAFSGRNYACRGDFAFKYSQIVGTRCPAVHGCQQNDIQMCSHADRVTRFTGRDRASDI